MLSPHLPLSLSLPLHISTPLVTRPTHACTDHDNPIRTAPFQGLLTYEDELGLPQTGNETLDVLVAAQTKLLRIKELTAEALEEEAQHIAKAKAAALAAAEEAAEAAKSGGGGHGDAALGRKDSSTVNAQPSISLSEGGFGFGADDEGEGDDDHYLDDQHQYYVPGASSEMPIPNNIRVDPIRRLGDGTDGQLVFADWADELEYDEDEDVSSEEGGNDLDEELEGLDEEERKRLLRKRERERAKRRVRWCGVSPVTLISPVSLTFSPVFAFFSPRLAPYPPIYLSFPFFSHSLARSSRRPKKSPSGLATRSSSSQRRSRTKASSSSRLRCARRSRKRQGARARVSTRERRPTGSQGRRKSGDRASTRRPIRRS